MADKKVEASFDELVLIESHWNRIEKSSECSDKGLFMRAFSGSKGMERDRAGIASEMRFVVRKTTNLPGESF